MPRVWYSEPLASCNSVQMVETSGNSESEYSRYAGLQVDLNIFDRNHASCREGTSLPTHTVTTWG